MIKKIFKEGALILALSMSIVLLAILSLNILLYFSSNDKARSAYKNDVSSKNKVEISKNPTLIIPKLEIKAPIVFSTSNNEKQIDVDLRNGISHRFGTANPGQKGNVFLVGHSSNYPWEKGDYNQVFAYLNKLETGDILYVDYENKRYTYKVSEKKIVSPSDVSIENPSDDFRLTLMTCYPPGTTLKRLAVISELQSAGN